MKHSFCKLFTTKLLRDAARLFACFALGSGTGVLAQNTAPTISDIPNQTTSIGVPTSQIPFTIGDAETPASQLTLTRISSNPTLVPVQNILFGGGDGAANRALLIFPAPGQSGTATITIAVSDNNLSASDSFVLTVSAGGANTPPTISDIPNQTTTAGTSTGDIPFTVGDAETQATSLSISWTSSNTTLVPEANIQLGGSGANRTLRVTPALAQTGTSTITVSVSDGTAVTSDTFTVTVSAGGGNTPPTITDIPNQSTAVSTPTAPILFTVGDAQTAAASLTVSTASSNPTLVPPARILLGAATGPERSLIVIPETGLTGTAIITVTVSDGTLTASDTFTLSVGITPQNTPPTLSDLPNQTTSVNTPTVDAPFTVADTETPASSLTLSAASSNTTLVPVANVQFGGSGQNRTIVVIPAPNQSGSATITVTVSDGSLSTADTFVLTVNPPVQNTPPTISAIPNQITGIGVPTAPIPFTIFDAETSVNQLTLTANSGNTNLVPKANIVISGTGGNRSMVITPLPGQSGTANISMTVSDGQFIAFRSFILQVSSVANSAPSISSIADVTTAAGTATASIPFTVSDAETPVANLTLTAASSNTTLIPVANVVLGGSGADRTVRVTPAAGQSGSATITVTVNDGFLSASEPFLVTVTAAPVNTAPTISNVADLTTARGVPTPVIPFTVADAETAASSLLVTTASSNPTLVPPANIVLGGSGANRTVQVTPAAGQSGSATITLTVSDGVATASDPFVLTVTTAPANTPPTISSIADLTTPKDTVAGPILFTVGDAETAAGDLTLSGASSNPAVVQSAKILFGGSGSSRAVIVTPETGQTGTSTITITVSDGTATASESFVLTVGQVVVNTPPDISDIADQTALSGAVIGPLAFTVADAQTPVADLQVAVNSSNANLIPISSVTFGGSGANRTLTITLAAGKVGSATLTVTVSDGTLTDADTILVNVNAPVNTAPSISNIPDQSTLAGTPTAAIAFTVSDVETAADSLIVTGSSSNLDLVPSSSIQFSGTGAVRSLIVRPAGTLTGTAVITVGVTDGSLSTTDTFVLTVSPIEPPVPPTISQQPTNQAVPQGGTAVFTVVATGTAPLTYQWLFDGAEIPNATASTLTLQNVQTANVGSYSVIVGNAHGLRISQSARLDLKEGLKLDMPKVLPGGFIQISITGTPGEIYELQVTSDFNSWTSVAVLSNTSGTVLYIDPDSVALRKRYYRVLVR